MTTDEPTTALTTNQPRATLLWNTDDREKALNYLRMLCEKASDAELLQAFEICVYKKLNPLLKEVFLIKYGSGPIQIQTAWQVYLQRAFADPTYECHKAGIVAFKDNETIEREGSLKLPGETIVGGWARVYRKNREPHFLQISFDEYYKPSTSGRPNLWDNKPATMIRKVALSQCLREALALTMSSLFSEAELGPEEEVLQIEEPRKQKPDELSDEDRRDLETVYENESESDQGSATKTKTQRVSTKILPFLIAVEEKIQTEGIEALKLMREECKQTGNAFLWAEGHLTKLAASIERHKEMRFIVWGQPQKPWLIRHYPNKDVPATDFLKFEGEGHKIVFVLSNVDKSFRVAHDTMVKYGIEDVGYYLKATHFGLLWSIGTKAYYEYLKAEKEPQN